MSGEESNHLFGEDNVCIKCKMSTTVRTLHCPNKPVDALIYKEIFVGEKDYRFGVWVNACSYVNVFDPNENLRTEKLLTKLLLLKNKVIPIEAYKHQKMLIASYGKIIESN